MITPPERGGPSGLYLTISQRLVEMSSVCLPVALMALAVVVYAHFRFWERPAEGDPAIWDYMTQIVRRGGVPYLDAVDFKTPLSAYIGAAAVSLAQPFGLRDIFALRITFLLLASMTVALTFEVARDYFASTRIALLSALLMISFNAFPDWNSSGVEPKTLTALFGLAVLMMVHRKRPLLAGFFGMLAALSWQPGLLFVGVAGLAFSGYLARWRDRRVFEVVLGATVPLAMFIVYFWALGALKDVYLWTVHFNYTIHGPRGIEAGETLSGRIWPLIQSEFVGEQLYFWLAVLGLLITPLLNLKHAKRNGWRALRDTAPRHAIVIAPITYLAFCAVSLQGGRDLIPLLPFVAMFAAAAVIFLLDWAVQGLARLGPGELIRLPPLFFAVTCILVFKSTVADAIFLKPVLPTLSLQEREVAQYAGHLDSGDTIFTHGSHGALVLLGLSSSSKYHHLNRRLEGYIDLVEPGGFDGWLERLRAQPPRMAILARGRSMAYEERIEAWLRQDYVPHRASFYTYYFLK
jgi:hypothetical protein